MHGLTHDRRHFAKRHIGRRNMVVKPRSMHLGERMEPIASMLVGIENRDVKSVGIDTVFRRVLADLDRKMVN